MCRIVTIDIETLPAPEPEDFAEMTGKKLDDYLKTSLSGDFGRILCIGYIAEDEQGNLDSGVIGWNAHREEFTLDEQAILRQFWRVLEGFSPRRDVIVGHNIFDFDLKFIYKRSIIHKLRPSVDLSFARYRSAPIFDTMHEWEKWSYGSKISLDKLARVLSLPSSKAGGIDGSLILPLFKEGQHRVIRDYCMEDVEVTRAIYRRMVFADSGPDQPLESTRDLAESAVYA
jgi:hypothetical protein